jgi:hypothetical protein
MRPALADFPPLPADGVTGKRRATVLLVTLGLPEGCPSIPELERLAGKVALSLDEFISRAVINYAEEVEADLSNPALFCRVQLPD